MPEPSPPARKRDGIISQNQRLLKLDTPLGHDRLLPQRAYGNDRLGRSYTCTVDTLTLDADLDVKSLIAQPVTLWIQQGDKSYRPLHGYVYQVKRLGSDGEFTAVQISFAPWLHFLHFRKDARVWQDRSLEDILTDVFSGHQHARGNFRFDVKAPPPIRSYCTQYESDWNFVHRLMEEEGWFCYHEQRDDGSGHLLVVTDRTQDLPAMAQREVTFHRAGTADEIERILQWNASRSLSSSQLSTTTFDYKSPRSPKNANSPVMPRYGALPEELEVYEYTGAYAYATMQEGRRQTDLRVEQWESAIHRYTGVSGHRALEVGRYFLLMDHPAHARDRVEEREFIVIAMTWYAENNLPLSRTVSDFPGSLKRQLDAFRSELGVAAAGDTERTGHCFNRFEVQRRNVPYRSAREHHKPSIHSQTAIVAGPASEEIHTDHLNRIKVRFFWVRQDPGDEWVSCWLRVLCTSAGHGWGSVRVPRIGEEVMVSFLNGDLDRPIVTGVVSNGDHTPAWHSDGRLSGYKSKEYKGNGFNQLVFDDNTGQNRVHLYSTTSNAQLNLGYLVAQHGNSRQGFYGSGFALTTDHYGAITAGQGLYISTIGRPGARGSQLSVEDARQQLEAGAELTKGLGDLSSKAKAEPLDARTSLEKFIKVLSCPYEGQGQQGANRFAEPTLLLASAAGIALTTPASTHIHAGEHATVTVGKDYNFAVAKNWIASVAEKFSLFVQNAGVKLFAAKGNVEIQAQSGDLDLIAEKVLRLLSTTDRIEIAAKTEVLLTAGGSFIRLNAAGITNGTPGKWETKAAQKTFDEPAQLTHPLPVMPRSVCKPCLTGASASTSPFAANGGQ